MSKIKVMVLMGGKTAEHAVSLVSGREVVRHLDGKKYEIIPVIISPDGEKWRLKSKKEILSLSPAGVGKALPAKQTAKKGTKLAFSSQNATLKTSRPDVVFLALHGPFGEDGTIQGTLDLAGIPYTGSGVLASGLGMDKMMFRKIMEREKILAPRYLIFGKKDNPNLIFKNFKFPFIVKPSNQGSSIGVSLVSAKSELKKALGLAFSYSKKILIEEYLKGKEVQDGVLGNENPVALPVVEIIPKVDFFDYQAKYQKDLCEEIVPARISKKLTKEIQNLAIKVFQAIGAQGLARVDMIIFKGKIYVLEINTIPGLTPNSLFPKEAQAAGISYPQLLDQLIELALEK